MFPMSLMDVTQVGDLLIFPSGIIRRISTKNKRNIPVRDKQARAAIQEKNRPGATSSEGVRESFWLQGMMAGFPASYFCIKAFSETDLTEDLKRFDVPTLILHGDDDQIVPIGASALLSSKIVRNSKLVVYKGAPHGMCTTLKDRVNVELLEFLSS